MQLKITQGDWQTKKLTIKDGTHKVLKNGKTIPTFINMQRRAVKV